MHNLTPSTPSEKNPDKQRQGGGDDEYRPEASTSGAHPDIAESVVQLKGTLRGQIDLELGDLQGMSGENFRLSSDEVFDAPPPYFNDFSQLTHGHAARASFYGPGVAVENLMAYNTPICLNIVIHIVGSRGDVAPFLPIAQLLTDKGHRVRVATHARFAAWVRSHGLEFYPIGADPETLMEFMVKNGGLIPSIDSVVAGDIQKNRAELDELIRGAYTSCTEPDEETGLDFIAHAIIAHPASFGSPHAAESLGIPIQLFSPMPWAPTSAFPHPFTNIESTGNHTKFANLITYEAVHQMTWAGCGDLVNATRTERGLGYASAASVSAGMTRMPQTYLISPTVLPPSIDYGELIEVTGFCFQQPKASVGDLAPEILSFLQAGPPPIYCGFGSIVGFDLANLYAQFIEAVDRLGLRAIICTGWGNVDIGKSNDVLVIKEFCHHGGAGTTAAGLRHGKPTMIVSFFGDQPFWGRVVAARGAGPLPINARAVTVSKLIASLQTCSRQDVRKEASGIATLIAAERGAASAVHSFLTRVPWQRMASDLSSDQVAAVIHTATKTRMSVLEAQILVLAEEITLKKLERYRPSDLTFADHIDGSMNIVKTMAGGFSNVGLYVDHAVWEIEVADQRQSHANCQGGWLPFLSPMKGIFCTLGNVAVGLNRAQRIYDPTFRPSGKVTDFKSGMAQGLKSFAVNFGGAATDLIVKPSQLAMKEGLLFGYVNVPVKLAVAGLDLLVLPCKGIYRGLHPVKEQDILGMKLQSNVAQKGASKEVAIAEQTGCSVHFVQATLAVWEARV